MYIYITIQFDYYKLGFSTSEIIGIFTPHTLHLCIGCGCKYTPTPTPLDVEKPDIQHSKLNLLFILILSMAQILS